MKRRIATAVAMAVAFAAVASVAPVAAQDSKPRIAVLEFKNKADNQWWYSGGAEAAQDVFVTELAKSGRFRVVEREQLAALMEEKNLALSGDVDPSTAVKAGKLLGVKYLLTGAVTEYGAQETRRPRRLSGRFLGGQEDVHRRQERTHHRHRHRRDRVGRRTRRGARTPTSSSRSPASAAASRTTPGCSTR